MKSNEELQKDVQEALKYEPLLHAAEIGVIAKDGIITLTGTVDDHKKKVEAESAAKQVKGVKAVVERIEVLPATHLQKTDEDIAQAIVKALRWTWSVPDDKIVAKVEKSWVWLEGTVEKQYQRESAKRVASGIPGVKGVTNNILLRSEVQDRLEKETIEKALKNNWAVDATNVNIRVDHNKVTLSGTVDSLYERSQVAKMAWKAPGVTDVENKLDVEFAEDIY